MARFLNAKATNHFVEQLIRAARQRLVIFTPILKLNIRLRDLLERKQRQGTEILLVYSHSRLDQEETEWLEAQSSLRLRRLGALHAKCFLNDDAVILASLNPYEFGDMKRNEMGILVIRDEEPELYKSMYEDIHRQIGDSRESRPRLSVDEDSSQQVRIRGKIPDWQLASLRGIGIDRLYDTLVAQRLLTRTGKKTFSLTEKGVLAGGETAFSKPYGPYFRWPPELILEPPSFLQRLRTGFGHW